MLRLVIALSLAALFVAPLHAQSVSPERLDELAQKQAQEKARQAELEKSRSAVRGDIQNLKTSLTRTAQEAERLEAKGRDIQSRLTQLETKAEDLRRSIYGDRQALTKLLAALQRAERNPPPALAISPEDAANAARAARQPCPVLQCAGGALRSIGRRGLYHHGADGIPPDVRL